MNILVIDNKSHFLDKLTKLISNQKNDIETVEFNKIVFAQTKNYDAVILSGGSKIPIVNHTREFTKELQLIKQATIPLLGICLGFELIAYAYGARLKQLKIKEQGIIDMKIVTPDPIFKNIPNLKIFESHRWVTENTPEDLIELARSDDGVEMFKHKNKLLYGVQFHPEMFPDQTTGDEMFFNFLKLVKNEKNN